MLVVVVEIFSGAKDALLYYRVMFTNVSTLSARVARGLGSAWAWRVVLGLFLLEALWFVASARYPMAFDENYHFGLIQLHAQQWLPFFTSQPDHASVYGAIVRDPSYLYHWLMSFPYRFILLFTQNQTAQIICLRLINVALCTYGLFLYRRVIRAIGASKALTNSLFAVFVLVPVVPFLAAHINYDNLFFVALPLSVLLALKLMRGFSNHAIDATTSLLLLTLLFLACLIKYSFLPVALVAGLFVLWRLWRAKLCNRAGFGTFWNNLCKLSRVKQVLLVTACLLSFGLFAERYAVNTVAYHNPVPACNAVISEDECLQYGPYGRDQLYTSEKLASFHPHLWSYAWQWLYGMWYRLFFAVNYDYFSAPPLLVVSVLAVVLAVWAVLGIGLRFRWLFAGQPARQLLLWLTLGYGLVLFADGFSAYARTGQPVAINGRYLVPFLPFCFAFGGLAWSQILHRHAAVKTAVASLVIALFVLQGGGTMTFIIRSADSWLWPNPTVISINREVRSIAWPVILGKKIY